MKIYSQIIIVFFSVLLFSQVGIVASTPDVSAALEFESTASGILMTSLPFDPEGMIFSGNCWQGQFSFDIFMTTN